MAGLRQCPSLQLLDDIVISCARLDETVRVERQSGIVGNRFPLNRLRE